MRFPLKMSNEMVQANGRAQKLKNKSNALKTRTALSKIVFFFVIIYKFGFVFKSTHMPFQFA